MFHEYFFTGGCPPAGPTVRDESQKQRTCVAAKAALFSSLSDELRRVIGENVHMVICVKEDKDLILKKLAHNMGTPFYYHSSFDCVMVANLIHTFVVGWKI